MKPGATLQRSFRRNTQVAGTRCPNRMSDPSEKPDHGMALEEARPKVKRPPLFRVVMLNDDFTPMEFVVEVLEKFFGHVSCVVFFWPLRPERVLVASAASAQAAFSIALVRANSSATVRFVSGPGYLPP